MEPVQDFEGLAFRFLVAIDVEGFSKLHAAEESPMWVTSVRMLAPPGGAPFLPHATPSRLCRPTREES